MRKIYYLPLDAIDLLLGRRDELTPPRSILPTYAIRDDFGEHGEAFLQLITKLCDLKPDERVLDIGCGIGRIAVPLASYLDGNGSYEGLDIVADSINWCKKEISAKHPNFRFQWADIFNQSYNPDGRHRASEYRFPYPGESFDLVFLKSVFTHMLPQDVENYLGEVARVLKRNGRSLVTFFLLNHESLELIRAGKSKQAFQYDFGAYRTANKDLPESVVAYDEEFIRRLYERHRLTLVEPINYGSWPGRQDSFYGSQFGKQDSLFNQDIVVAVKN